MIPARIANATRTLGQPVDWDAETPVGTLWIRDEMVEGVNFMRSAWTPTPAELDRLRTGATVILSIAGVSHPVVNMEVGEPPA